MIHQRLIIISFLKHPFKWNTYFELLEHKKAIDFCRFRTTNNKLPIEQGGWDNIDRNNRICFLCNSDIGDEFHYILQCQYFKRNRKLLLSKYHNNHVNVEKVFCDPG
jgi:hypothetical protein